MWAQQADRLQSSLSLHQARGAGASLLARAQTARVLIGKFAVRSNRVEIAEAALAEFVTHQPQNPLEHLVLERTLANTYRRLKKNEQAATHGLVDPYFPRLVEQGLAVRAINFRTEAG